MYLDTAILVKLYVRESDSDHFARLADGQSIVSSTLALTEFWSALLGKERGREIDAALRHRAWTAFEADIEAETIRLEPIRLPILKKANRILANCHPRVPLRSLDSIHLATCDHLQDWPLCTTDRRMLDAAVLLGFPVAAGA